MLKALPGVEYSGLTDEACEAPAGLVAVSWPANPVASYPDSSLELLLGSLHYKSVMIDNSLDSLTYNTCLLTLLSPFASPILDSKASSRLPRPELACGSPLAGAPNLTSSYLSPPGLSICREMPWSFPSEDAAVVGLEGACPAPEPDSACALRDAGEPYTVESGQ
jgi:hypothetical protein